MILKKKILVFISVWLSFMSHANDGITAACPTLAMTGTSVSCYGYSNGSAQVTISNGSGNYTVNWSNGVTATSNPGLVVGTYTVTVKDNVSGCSVNGAYVVSSPDAIQVTNAITDVDCNGNSTGKVDITVIGGTAPYSYTWKNASNVTVDNNQDLTGSVSGTFSVAISDTKGCTYSESFSISQPAQALNSSIIKTNVSCYAGSDAALDLSVWGGTPAYTYAWSNGKATQDISGLTAGNYSVVITDANGCKRNQSYTITQPTVLAGTYSVNDVLCHGDATGSISFTTTGGTSPFDYSWKNTSNLYAINSPNLSAIIADDYELTVTDVNGCTYTTTMTVNEPSVLNTSLVVTDVKCYGGTDGSIDLSVSGGTNPYQYTWKNSLHTVVGNGQDLLNIPADIYSLHLVDGNGCSVDLSQKVAQPEKPISVDEILFDVLCYGDNTGYIDLTISGGTAPYTTAWSNGQGTEDIQDLLAGPYNYLVTDANGCTYTNNLTINQPAQPITVTYQITDVNCYGESNGKIDLSVSGGTPGYHYTWQNSTFQLSKTSQDLIDFPADDYRFQITDSNQCIYVDTLTIHQPTPLVIHLAGVNILCKGEHTGSIDLTLTGGTPGYTYNWSNGYTAEDLSQLYAGKYSVIAKDNHNCQITDSIVLTEPLDSLKYSYIVSDATCYTAADGTIEVAITGGTLPYSIAWASGAEVAKIVDLTAGDYGIHIEDFNGCKIDDNIKVGQPNPVTLHEQITPVTCYGLSDGQIKLTPSGGTAPYRYSWMNSTYALSTQKKNLVNYPADTYQVTLTDTNDCEYAQYITIPQPPKIQIDYTEVDVRCYNGHDGQILVDVSGGNPGGYTTQWSNGVQTEDNLNVPYGTYSIVVTDTKNCKDSIQVVVNQPDTIRMKFDFTQVSCIDHHDGTANATATGGNGGYSYLWSEGTTTAGISGMSNQFYSLVITDVLGCKGKDSLFIPKDLKGCIYPVNTFTPNGDNYNDQWIIDNMQLYPAAEVKVYDRWGKIVHQQNGIYSPWNGNIHGVDAPSDTYYYYINLNHPDRDPLTGNIIIVR